MDDETDGAGGNGTPFDHTELETIGRAIADAGRGLVRFGSEYPYLGEAEREVRRQRVGRIVALMNSLWPQADAAIKADHRPPIRDHQRDGRLYHVDRLFRLMEVVASKKTPKED